MAQHAGLFNRCDDNVQVCPTHEHSNGYWPDTKFRKGDRPGIMAADCIATHVIGLTVSSSRSQGENACCQAADERMGTPPFEFTCSLAKFIAESWALPCPLLYRLKGRNSERKIPTQHSPQGCWSVSWTFRHRESFAAESWKKWRGIV